jgi:hypothetical protein
MIPYSVHTDSPESAALALTEGVQLFAAASNSRLNKEKSHGMGLGPLSTMSGLDSATGVTFTSEALRHLGVMVGHDESAMAEATFIKRRAAVCAAIRTWAPHCLTYVGRLHVAKSVLASTLYHHATFLPLPPSLLSSIRAIIDGYLVAGALQEGTVAPRGWAPGLIVESLPKADGGLGRVDIELQIQALHAKVAAKLLHPAPHLWKTLMAHAFERAHPGLGTGALVSRKQPHQGVGRGLGARRLALWAAFATLQPFRIVPSHYLTSWHVRQERLRYNARVANPTTGRHLAALPRPLPSPCSTVGELGAQLASDDPIIAQAAASVFQCLPESWREHACGGPIRQPVWERSTCGTYVRYCRDANVHPVRVLRDGRLDALDIPLEQLPALSWIPAHVTFAPCLPDHSPLVVLPSGGHLRGFFW